MGYPLKLPFGGRWDKMSKSPRPRLGRGELLDTDILQVLACPRDRAPLENLGTSLACTHGHRFSIEEGVPVFAERPRREISPRNLEACRFDDGPSSVDPFVNDWLVNTNGNLYRKVRGKLDRYPIPDWPFQQGAGKLLVDIGCSWGRWSVAASRAGFRTIGVDLHFNALAAAVRVARQLDVGASYACSEANVLPLASASADFIFSYSVLQHLERAKVNDAFREISRVLKPGATCLVQLPNTFGFLSLLRQARRGFRDGMAGTSEMRYWSRAEIASAVTGSGLRLVSIRADGFLSQNPRLSDLDLLPAWGKTLVLASYAGCRASALFPPLVRVADSLWVEARAPESQLPGA
jgi:SAM-dependent methyltransferase